MKSISQACRTLFRKLADEPRLSRIQFAIGIVALLWGLPALAIVFIAWEPILTVLGSDNAPSWAGAIGSIAAAWAAMAAAIYPQWVRRREEKSDGAAEAVARKNVVALALATLAGLDGRYRVNESNLLRLRDERLAGEHKHREASKRLGETGPYDVRKRHTLKGKVAAATTTLEQISSDIEHCHRIRDAIGETLSDAMLRLEAIPASTIRRFDFLLGTHITQAINQLHTANAVFKHYRSTSTFDIAVDSAVAALRDYMQRVKKAEKYVERISAPQH